MDYMESKLLEYKLGLHKVSFTRIFRTPNGITHILPDAWVPPFKTYSKCGPFLLDIPNFKSPSGKHIMFMYRKGNLLVVHILTPSFLSEVGGFVLFVHIYAVNCRCGASCCLIHHLLKSFQQISNLLNPLLDFKNN